MSNVRVFHTATTILGSAALATAMVVGLQAMGTAPPKAGPGAGSPSAKAGAPAQTTQSALRPQADTLAHTATASNMATTQPPEVEQASLALERRVAELEARVRQQDRSLRYLRESTQAAAPADLDEATLAALADEAQSQAEEAELQAQDRIWELETQFDLEPVDARWSAAATLDVNDAITGAGVEGVDVLDLDCRASACRVEVDFSSPEAQAEIEIALTRLPFELAPGNAPGESSGTGSRTYYMTKPDDSQR